MTEPNQSLASLEKTAPLAELREVAGERLAEITRGAEHVRQATKDKIITLDLDAARANQAPRSETSISSVVAQAVQAEVTTATSEPVSAVDQSKDLDVSNIRQRLAQIYDEQGPNVRQQNAA